MTALKSTGACGLQCAVRDPSNPGTSARVCDSSAAARSSRWPAAAVLPFRLWFICVERRSRVYLAL